MALCFGKRTVFANLSFADLSLILRSLFAVHFSKRLSIFGVSFNWIVFLYIPWTKSNYVLENPDYAGHWVCFVTVSIPSGTSIVISVKALDGLGGVGVMSCRMVIP